jgi:hypothetical protein
MHQDGFASRHRQQQELDTLTGAEKQTNKQTPNATTRVHHFPFSPFCK